jgi:hypothetical protein
MGSAIFNRDHTTGLPPCRRDRPAAGLGPAKEERQYRRGSDRVVKVGQTTVLRQGVATAVELDDMVVEFDRALFPPTARSRLRAPGRRRSAPAATAARSYDLQGRACAVISPGRSGRHEPLGPHLCQSDRRRVAGARLVTDERAPYVYSAFRAPAGSRGSPHRRARDGARP